jgi:uncharacterized protein Yka (UPF0111/DUF47 family)
MTHAWFSWVRSKDIEIMKVLEEQSSNLVKATSVLVELFSNYNSLKNSNSILKDLEHTGDNLTHKLFTIIDKTFVTPIDKEDISELTSTIDQVLDAAYGTSDKLVLFRIAKPSSYMYELAKLLHTASQGIYEAVTKLNKLSHPNLIG